MDGSMDGSMGKRGWLKVSQKSGRAGPSIEIEPRATGIHDRLPHEAY